MTSYKQNKLFNQTTCSLTKYYRNSKIYLFDTKTAKENIKTL